MQFNSRMETTETPRNHASRPGLRLIRALLSIDTYGPVLIAILISYMLASSATGESARALVLFAQIRTVWLVFRVAESRPSIRRATDILLFMSGIAAAVNLLGEHGDIAANALFAVSCVLYFIAPVGDRPPRELKPRVSTSTRSSARSPPTC